MKTDKTPVMTAVAGQTLFTLDGMEYYMVDFKLNEGETWSRHRDAKDALEVGGHTPAKVRDVSIFARKEFRKHKGWITLFDCRDDMKDRVGYFLDRSTGMAQSIGLASQNDGLMFYNLDHGSAGEYPALCWKKTHA